MSQRKCVYSLYGYQGEIETERGGDGGYCIGTYVFQRGFERPALLVPRRRVYDVFLFLFKEKQCMYKTQFNLYILSFY
jgi:hypothetical protein